MSIAKLFTALLALTILSTLGYNVAAAATEKQSLVELRDTVINLLQALVDQGVLTREKANQLVKQAQDKAAADAAAMEKADEGAVRVPYVPEMVKDEIRKQVEQDLKPAVVTDVLREAKTEKWGVPGALPEWLGRIKVSGELSLRAENIVHAKDNQQQYYLDFNKINAAGGITKAGTAAYLNVTEDQPRLRARARLGFEADLTESLQAGVRFSTGTNNDLVSEFQTLGNTPGRYLVGIDQLFLRWDKRSGGHFPWLSVVGGRFASPWLAPTDLIFHKDLTFEGVAATGRLGFGDGTADQSHAFLTVGALPIQEIALSPKDKWLAGAQLGSNLRWNGGQRLRIAAAYYDFLNVAGRQNVPSTSATGLLDFTAPQFLRTGNTLFDIRNDTDPTTNLFALASDFRLVNIAATYDLPVGEYTFDVTAEAVRNIGFNRRAVLERTGKDVAARNKGYQAELSFGHPRVRTAGAWRAVVGYRYLQRDAVIDGLTDSDFRSGGTDASGYYVTGDLGIADRIWLRLRYLTADQIDGPRFGVDTLQFDINAQF